MPWQRAGTVSVQANSTTVTGLNVDFAANSRIGDSFIGPDGFSYEVANVASATVISILPPYKGPTVSGAAYAIMPVQGYDKMLSDAFNNLNNQFGPKLAALGTTGNYDILPVSKGGTGGTTEKMDRASALIAEPNNTAGGFTYSAVGNGSNPTELNVGFSIFTIPGSSGSNAAQFAWPLTSVTANKNRVWYRQAFNNVWSPWTENITVTSMAALFGIGGTSNNVTDLDVLFGTNVYRALGTATGTPVNQAGMVQHMQYGTTVGSASAQVYVTYEATPRMFYRSRPTNGVYTAWISTATKAELDAKLNISRMVGVVSQSGGVPTGAIIERGSNANGDFTKFADGTMICTRTRDAGAQTLAAAGGVAFIGPLNGMNYAATFVGTPVVDIQTISSGALSWASMGSAFPGTTASQGYFLMTPVPGTYAFTVQMTAIGRWF